MYIADLRLDHFAQAVRPPTVLKAIGTGFQATAPTSRTINVTRSENLARLHSMSTLAVTVLTVFQVNGTHPLHRQPFLLSQDMKRCTGCERTFSAKGYTLHVTGTSRSGCQVAFRSQVNQHEISDDTGPRVPKLHTIDVSPCYDEDYSSGSDSDGSDLDSESGVGENDVVVDETGSLYEGDEGDDSEHEETIELHSGSPQRVPESSRKEAFPGKTAGAPILTKNQSAFSAYQQKLNGDNNYDPFVSKLDWEVAQWAKTCGISSAALTRLLQINGVSLFIKTSTEH